MRLGDKMRLATLLAPCLGLALMATAGCDPRLESQYFREGIGTDLNRPQLADATQILNLYIGHICKQAGLDIAPDEPAASCTGRHFAAEQWVEFVKAGMNDIDLRCDAYLAWLDDRRRSAQPIIQQISSLRSVTQAVLDATGVGPHPMTIVGNALGFASSTFTNVNSRLLLEVNHSTVQSVVHKGQEDFRAERKYYGSENRSDAIYYLRSYLRLCMPFTIETDINTTVSVAKRVGPESLVNKPFISPTQPDVPPVQTAGTPKASEGVAMTPAPKETITGGKTKAEKNIKLAVGIRIQKGLGAKEQTGDFSDPDTRSAIQQFQKGYRRAQVWAWKQDPRAKAQALAKAFDPAKIGTEIDPSFKPGFEVLASVVETCSDKVYRTPYEAGVFIALRNTKPNGMRTFLDKASGKAEAEGKFKGALKRPALQNQPMRNRCKIDNDVRAAIATLRMEHGLPPAASAKNDDIDDALMEKF